MTMPAAKATKNSINTMAGPPTSQHDDDHSKIQPAASAKEEQGSQLEDDPEVLDDSVEAAEAAEKRRREREARAQALTLEIVGDLPFAEVKPPENILFVCKLNPVTQDDDLELIFSRFGKIISCEVIRDKRTKDSLQYAFIEYEMQKDCEQAYFKMQGVLIDDHRIHVDFSQSVSRLSETWRTATNSKRAKQGGGFGGISGLEKKRQYKVMDTADRDRGYGMVFDKNGTRRNRDDDSTVDEKTRRRSRSRSPRRHRNRDGREDRGKRYDDDRYRDRRKHGDYHERDRR